jgi:hypothetical protein
MSFSARSFFVLNRSPVGDNAGDELLGGCVMVYREELAAAASYRLTLSTR